MRVHAVSPGCIVCGDWSDHYPGRPISAELILNHGLPSNQSGAQSSRLFGRAVGGCGYPSRRPFGQSIAGQSIVGLSACRALSRKPVGLIELSGHSTDHSLFGRRTSAVG